MPFVETDAELDAILSKTIDRLTDRVHRMNYSFKGIERRLDELDEAADLVARENSGTLGINLHTKAVHDTTQIIREQLRCARESWAE